MAQPAGFEPVDSNVKRAPLLEEGAEVGFLVVDEPAVEVFLRIDGRLPLGRAIVVLGLQLARPGRGVTEVVEGRGDAGVLRDVEAGDPLVHVDLDPDVRRHVVEGGVGAHDLLVDPRRIVDAEERQPASWRWSRR